MNNQNLPDNPDVVVQKANKTGLFTNYIYKAIPLAFDESMSYYETLCGLLNYLQNTIIPTVNNNADAVSELQNLYIELKDYVEHYFDNLDVQQEINNKLDQMAQDGSLTNLIKNYVDPFIDAQNLVINEFKNSVNTAINTIDNKVDDVISGAPLVADSTTGMTDTSRIYVNSTNGKWYYYDGNSWKIGGDYLTDPVQDYIINFVEGIQSIDTTSLVSGLISGKFINGTDGSLGTFNNSYASDYVEIPISNVKYKLKSGSTQIIEASGLFGLGFYDENQHVISSSKYSDLVHTNTSIEFIPPKGTKYIRFSIKNVPDSLSLYILSAKDIYDYILDYVDDSTELLDDFNNVDITKSLTIGGFINYSTGAYSTTSRTDFAATDEYTKILPAPFTLISQSTTGFEERDQRGLAFYDVNKNYISGIQYSNSNDNKLVVTEVPENAYYIRYTITRYTANDTLTLTYNNIYELFDVFNEKTKNSNRINQDYLASFLNVGVVGDSFASGCTKVTNAQSEDVFVDFYNHSWPQYLARKLGTNYTNYSYGGATAKTFITNSTYGLPKIVADSLTNPCELYLIGLGINDSWSPSSLGTTDDIGTDTDSFYGNYSKIISTIKTLHPDAIIMCMTMPIVSPATNRDAFNGAIENIVNYYTGVYLIDCASINDYNNELIKQYRYGHLDALGYSLSADILHKAINEVIYNNLEDFNHIETINTDYSYLPEI